MGLGKGATQEEIRSKYRELTKTYHPDKVQGTAEEKEAAHEKFVQIQQAYEKLSTLKKSRAKANKKHQTVEPEPAASDVKIELWRVFINHPALWYQYFIHIYLLKQTMYKSDQTS